MKYVISSKRLNEFITRYLDNFTDQNVVMKHDPYIIISEPQVDDDPYRDWMEHDRLDGRLWINRKFLLAFVDLFGFDVIQAQEIISDWFEKKFNVVVKFQEVAKK